MNKITFIVILVLSTITIYSQNKFVASGDIFGRRVFIKNNGQFDSVLPGNKVGDYAYTKGDENVYFNKQGLTYFLQKHFPLTQEEKEEIEHGKKGIGKPSKKAFVSVSWENSNPNVTLELSEKQSYYHSFGEEKYKSECYKKLTYKNIYNHIDIEYVFTNEKDAGIKYNVVLRPGANIDDVKIKYSGDVENMVLKNGNIIIKTAALDVTELAPTSFQNKVKVESHFNLKNNIISFNLPNDYDHTKDLIIDPWVINLTLATNNYGYDVDYDNSGNYFIYGGSGPFLISKYSPAGVLLWTFGGVAPGWTSLGSQPSGKHTGNFIVDKMTGKCYTGEGFNISGTQTIRINTAGIYDSFISTAVSTWREVWDLAYDCNSGNIFELGGTTGSNASAGILNTVTGSMVPQNFTGLMSIGQDVVSHAIDPNGNVFFVFASIATPAVDNKLLRVNPAFTGNVWIAPTTYNSLLEPHNKIYPALGTINSNGFNALAANTSYLFYYDGLNLAAYDKLTGVRVGFTVIGGQIVKKQGGIAVDECNNVYVGGNGSIVCYNFSGSSFVPNGLIPIASGLINQYVTDVKYNIGSNSLYVCGSGFGGIYTAINSSTCTVYQMSVTPVCVGPNNATAVASVTTNLIAPLISYTWTNSGGVVISQTINTPALTNSVTSLTNGIYTIYSQLNAPCGPVLTQTFAVNCGCISPIIGAISGPTLVCENTTHTYSVTSVIGVSSYSWQLPIGWSGSSITNTISVTINSLGGTISAIATNTCGTSLPTLLAISVDSPTITVNSGTICSGNSFTIIPSGASTYSYSGGSNIVSPTVTSNYTVTGANTFGCIGSITNTVAVLITPTLVPVSSPPSICKNDQALLTVFGATNYTWLPGSIVGNTNVVFPLSNTIYTVIGSNSSGSLTCSSSNTVLVSIKPLTIVSAFSNTSICIGNFTQISAIGGDSYKWLPIAGLMSPLTSITIAKPLVTTIYTVTAIATGSCSNTSTVQIIVNPLPIVNAGADTTINIDESYVLHGTANVTNFGFLSPSENPLVCNFCPVVEVRPINSTCYTLKAESSFGCVATDDICIKVTKDYEIFIPNAFTPNGDVDNEIFKPVGYGLSEIKLFIFDRWGTLIFSSHGATIGWNGIVKGQICPQGVYVYKAEVTTLGGKKFERIGHVTLLSK